MRIGINTSAMTSWFIDRAANASQSSLPAGYDYIEMASIRECMEMPDSTRSFL
ncbi:MAG TPA: hypothetical protein HPP81_08230 [Deltaproteobacteria bacterium]|jgi:hypothetical protein|nr:hypothetical protein [Deltaproteobacteria bacterium]